MNFKYLSLVFLLHFSAVSEAKILLKTATDAVSASARTASLPDCYNGFDPVNQLEEMSLPEMADVKEEVGIHIYFLKTAVGCQYSGSAPPIRYDFRPQADVAARTEFARKIAQFLKSFPKDFLQGFSGTRFILIGDLIDEASGHESDAITNHKTIFIKTDTVQSNIAHEFMHVFDFLNTVVSTESVNSTSWYQSAGSAQCSYSTNAEGEPLAFLGRTFNQCFVSGYAQRNNLEDRAEIFKGLTEDHAGMLDLANQPGSGQLSAKIAALKNELREKSENLTELFWTSRLKGNFYGSYESCSGTPRVCRVQNFPAPHEDWVD